ncbi:hypothetical protein KEJ18_02405 [Candidatus Bathyarchaeota archaeon]|nr:hypothetical protein [Candidatus Bathyarchaeota archaeon]
MKVFLAFLIIPVTLCVGIVLGRVIHGTLGIVVSAVAGATVYVFGLYALAGSAAIFTFDLFTQLLMVAFGAIMATFGWYMGENYELLFHRSRVKKIT